MRAQQSLKNARNILDKLAVDIPQKLQECGQNIDAACEELQKRKRGRGSSTFDDSSKVCNLEYCQTGTMVFTYCIPSDVQENEKLYHLFFEKTFERRESLLTDMLDSSPHYKTLYNISVAVMMWMMVNMMVDCKHFTT